MKDQTRMLHDALEMLQDRNRALEENNELTTNMFKALQEATPNKLTGV